MPNRGSRLYKESVPMVSKKKHRGPQRSQAGAAVLSLAIAVSAGTLLSGAPAYSASASGTPFSETWEGTSSPYLNFLPNGGSTITDGVADSAAVDGKVVHLTTPANPN